MAVPAEARTGHTVGLYRLHEVLGSGAMGVVYRGEHLYLGKEVAIKVLRVGLPRREQAVKSFLREARAASRITHAGIVAVTDFGKADDGTVFLVMELVRGEPLDFIIEREQRLHPARAMNLAMQIADASAAAHQQGIIHRDLKPANVMVSTRVEWSQGAGRPAGTDSAPNRTAATIFETIKLLDFGVAEMNDPETGGWLADPDTIVGTAEYIAPEVVHGMGIDTRADIYSLGVILYEMLAGSVPFRGVSAVDTMLKAAADPVPPLRSHGLDGSVVPDLDALLVRALAKDPADRHASVEEFMDDLRHCRSRQAGRRSAWFSPPAVLVGGDSRSGDLHQSKMHRHVTGHLVDDRRGGVFRPDR
jgi:serine/threonine-protein kinase